MAAIAAALAERGIWLLALGAASRDHLLVADDRLEDALDALACAGGPRQHGTLESSRCRTISQRCSPSGRATTPPSSSPAVLERWIEARAFEANADDPGEPYVIALPPPNVTGALHMGHALSGTIQDVLIRVHRMRGRNALWIYGTDHAGHRHADGGRAAARAGGHHPSRARSRGRSSDRVWQWRRETGTTITAQYLRLGASLDFRRERFTMDEGYAHAVTKVFVELYRKGYGCTARTA